MEVNSKFTEIYSGISIIIYFGASLVLLLFAANFSRSSCYLASLSELAIKHVRHVMAASRLNGPPVFLSSVTCPRLQYNVL